MHLVLRFFKPVQFVLIILPLLWSGLLVLYYFMCALELGRLPLPSQDDPKLFGFDALAFLLWTGLAIVLYSAPVVMLMLLFFRKKLKISTVQIGTYVAGAYVVVYFMVLDPMRIFSWFLD